MNKLAQNLEIIKKNIKKSSQDRQVTLVAVSKTFDANTVKEAINLGLWIFGENKVQECSLKFENILLEYPNIQLHMVGPLQRNKVKKALSLFDIIHTVDREKLVNEIKKNISQISKTKEFFVQINTGKEIQKSGIFPENANDFINWCKQDMNINITGLMCIPPAAEDPSEHFHKLKSIAEKNNLFKLSMGMSYDYEKALNFGATHIRLGTALFGKRNYA